MVLSKPKRAVKGKGRGKSKTKPLPKKGSLAASIADKKFWGEEPTFPEGYVPTASELGKAYTWYNYNHDAKDGKKFLIEYMKKFDPKRLKLARGISEKTVSQTMFWQARLLTLGTTLPENSLQFFNSRLEDALLQVKEEKEDSGKSDTPVPSVYDRTREKINDVIAQIEEVIDAENFDFSLYSFLKESEIPAMYGSRIADFYEPQALEANEALKGKDKDLVQGYSIYKKVTLRKFAKFLTSLVEEGRQYANVKKKVTRAKRKKKVLSADKIVAKLQYQKEDPELKIASVLPTDIHGAQYLWTYSTRYKIITRYVAQGPSGLSVKGTTIIGFDPVESKSTRIGRKTEEAISQALNGGKIIQRKFFDKHGSKLLEVKGRCNKNTILLRVGR